MIGRAAIGNPNIFTRLTNKKTRFTFEDYLKLAEKYNLPFRQIKLQAMNFTKNMKNAKKIRLKIFNCKTIEQLKNNL
jgi:tRNA-dihydrouridine synthase